MTMRIAYICADPGIPVFGTKGASVHVQEIIRAWRRRGADVRLYCVRTGDHVPADLADVPVTQLHVDKGEPAARELAQARVATELAERVVADGVDLVYERYSLFSTAMAHVVTAAGVPGVLEVNAPLIDEQARHRHLVDAATARVALRRQLRAAAAVPCVSAPVAGWVRTYAGPGAGDHRVVVVPNGVNIDRIQPVRPPVTELRSGPATVLFTGTLKPWHGTELLLRAATFRRTDWSVRLVGDGPQRPTLQAMAEREAIPVTFTGAVAPDQIPHAMAGAAVGVAPYPRPNGPDDHYFSPLKVIEYAAAGLPIVASAVGQVPQLLAGGRCGVLVPPGDPVALADAIDALVADPVRAAQLGDLARAEVAASRSWPAVLEASLRPIAQTAAAPSVGVA